MPEHIYIAEIQLRWKSPLEVEGNVISWTKAEDLNEASL